jgi:glycerophosphoryl diester phosphodiesterase
VLAVAHNAGNNAATTAAALRYGAEVIEIDVVRVRGRLAAGRAHGWWWLAERVFRGETLASAWDHAAAAKIVKLDLQQNDRGLLDALISFLGRVPANRPVMVSTRDPGAIQYLRPRVAPAVTLLFSVPFPDAVTRVETDRALAAAIGGISVFQGLVTASLVTRAPPAQAARHRLDRQRRHTSHQLLRLDVDGITTANLAMMRALAD